MFKKTLPYVLGVLVAVFGIAFGIMYRSQAEKGIAVFGALEKINLTESEWDKIASAITSIPDSGLGVDISESSARRAAKTPPSVSGSPAPASESPVCEPCYDLLRTVKYNQTACNRLPRPLAQSFCSAARFFQSAYDHSKCSRVCPVD